MAKHVKRWVEGCEQCAKDKRVPNATITPELLNLPEWDLGSEAAMQIDLLPNFPPSGGYENVFTAIDVFLRYLLAYPLTNESATNVAKVIIVIMTEHAYQPTTLTTDEGTAFTSTIIAEFAQILGITLNCATTKHPQSIGNWSELMHLSRRISRLHVGNIADNGIHICRLQSRIKIPVITEALAKSQLGYSMDEISLIS